MLPSTFSIYIKHMGQDSNQFGLSNVTEIHSVGQS